MIMNTINYCKRCKKEVHCCIFDNLGFTFVGLADAKRIKSKTKFDYCDFLDYSPLPKKTLKILKNDDPSLEGYLRFTELDKEGRLLRLKKKKDNRCIFLNDMKRCEIYDIRPNICRIYPFWAMKLLNGKIKIISHDPYPACTILNKIRLQKDIGFTLLDCDIKELKKIFSKIRKEDIYYKKNIKKFI